MGLMRKTDPIKIILVILVVFTIAMYLPLDQVWSGKNVSSNTFRKAHGGTISQISFSRPKPAPSPTPPEPVVRTIVSPVTGRIEIQLYKNGSGPPPEPVSKTQHEIDKAMFTTYSSIYQQPGINCADVFKGDLDIVKKAIDFAKDGSISMKSNEYYMNLTKTCDTFQRARGYITSPLSKQERDFPLAYSILAYKDVDMVERVLRAVYRPQNYYCVHLDQKSDNEFVAAMESVVGCFPNVHMASERINVRWGKITVLTPEIVCMKDLLAMGPWKYFINLTGQELPLKSNLELVKILTAYQGANDIEGTVIRSNPYRLNNKLPPEGLLPVKGSVHIVANRHYVDFVVNNRTAIRLLHWAKSTEIPDETYFAILNHNPQLGIPGTYPGEPEVDRTNTKPFIARFKNWGFYMHEYPCARRRVRNICILSTGDLPLLGTRPEMFANKFYPKEDQVVVGCLEERLFNNTRDGFLGVKQFDTTFYEGLYYVIHQVGKNVTRKFVKTGEIV